MPLFRFMAGIVAGVLATGIGVVPASFAAPSSQARSVPGAEATLEAVADAVPPGRDGRHTVLVRFHQPSLAAWHDGQLMTGSASATNGKRRLDSARPDAGAWLDELDRQQHDQIGLISRLLARDVQALHRYRYVLNGVALRLSLDEASRLQRSGLVRGVELDAVVEPLGDVGPGIIGAPFVWLGGGNNGLSNRGEGVVIGVVDSGIYHAHPSFAAIAPGDGYIHGNPHGVLHGLCAVTPALCNEKLIGSYDFTTGLPAGEDDEGHGTNTSSIAAGNPVEASTAGLLIPISGVAPRANLISYRACVASCFTSDVLLAIEQAVVDGVDVLQMLLSGPDNPWNNTLDLALLDAVAAGVFVVTSGGNSGPAAGTVARTSPWAATVTATTHSRLIGNDIDAAGLSMRGAPSHGPALGAPLTATIVDALTIAPGNALGCSPFPAGSLTGSIVLLDRGTCTFASKIDRAKDAGAIAVLILNNVGGPAITMGGTEGTTIPAMMINRPSGLALRSLISGGSMATLYHSTSISHQASTANLVHSIGGRGPSRFDMVKPDFAAPGVNVLSADLASVGDFAQRFGTSMAGAHVAGAGALLVGEKPHWSPSAIRSALALTARADDLRTHDGSAPANVLDAGSGLIDVGAASRTPLVLEESVANFAAANPESGGDPRTLNLPGLLDRNCIGSCRFLRTVTSVIDASQDYTITSNAAAGVTVAVSPDSFTLGPGASQQVQIDIGVNAGVAAHGQWHFGQIVIEPGSAARAPLLSQGFDQPAFPPPGWSAYKLAGGGPQQWQRTEAIASSPPASARHLWGEFGEGMQEGWLVAPQLQMPAGATLRFLDRGQFMTDYGYSGVHVSTGSCDPAEAEFAELREIADSPVGTWRAEPLTIDLSSYSDRTICLAFKYRGDYAHAWLIDDVRIDAPHPTLRIPLAVHAEQPVLEILPATLPNALRHSAWGESLSAVAAGTAAPYTFSLGAGTLPPGLTLFGNGVLAGVPSVAGSYTFTVTATDSTASAIGGPYAGSRAYTIEVLDTRIFRNGFESE
jgi:hypothetical protein